MAADNDSDDQTASETKKPRSRGTRPTDRAQAAAGPAATSAQPRQMPWDRPMGGQGQPQGGHPAFQWGGGGFQPGGIMGGQGQAQAGGGMPNWQALAQQFMQRFQGHPMMQRFGGGMPGQGQPPQPPQGMPQPGAAPQGGPLQDRIGQLAAMFGRQQPGGIVGPGQGPQRY